MGAQEQKRREYSFSQFEHRKIAQCLADMLKMPAGSVVYIRAPLRVVAYIATQFPQLIVFGPDGEDASKIDEAAQKLFGNGRKITLH